MASSDVHDGMATLSRAKLARTVETMDSSSSITCVDFRIFKPSIPGMVLRARKSIIENGATIANAAKAKMGEIATDATAELRISKLNEKTEIGLEDASI